MISIKCDSSCLLDFDSGRQIIYLQITKRKLMEKLDPTGIFRKKARIVLQRIFSAILIGQIGKENKIYIDNRLCVTTKINL